MITITRGHKKIENKGGNLRIFNSNLRDREVATRDCIIAGRLSPLRRLVADLSTTQVRQPLAQSSIHLALPRGEYCPIWQVKKAVHRRAWLKVPEVLSFRRKLDLVSMAKKNDNDDRILCS
jgi:hypothetical protein